MQTGLGQDPRTSNPHLGQPPYPPFLGVTNWPLVTSVMSALLTIGFFGYLVWRSIRQCSPHWLLIVGIAAFFAGALDPPANWATFAVFDPRVAHFPLSWPYFNAVPFSSRLCRSKHRLVALFVTGFVAGLPLNAFMQFMWLKVGLFVYSEAAGPVLPVFDRHLPLYLVIYDSVWFAVVALLCVRDDSWRPAVVAKLAVPTSTSRMAVVATAVPMGAVLVPIAVLSRRRSEARLRPLALSERQGLRPVRRRHAGRQARTVRSVIQEER
jgi:hypothetical protein